MDVTTAEQPQGLSAPAMRFYQHVGDGRICWTFSDSASSTHWRAPRPHERGGSVHCTYRHTDTATYRPIAESEARMQLVCSPRP